MLSLLLLLLLLLLLSLLSLLSRLLLSRPLQRASLSHGSQHSPRYGQLSTRGPRYGTNTTNNNL
jgi:hypothetical protein